MYILMTKWVLALLIVKGLIFQWTGLLVTLHPAVIGSTHLQVQRHGKFICDYATEEVYPLSWGIRHLMLIPR